jgi:uncharacterized iron-regulated protein
MQQVQQQHKIRLIKWLCRTCVCAALLSLMWGCTVAPKRLFIKDLSTSFDAETIISTKTGEAVSFDELMADLAGVRVIYVGEQHSDPVHHRIQLDIIKAVYQTDPDIVVGMEMFDHTYQHILDLWSAGELDQKTFLQKVHWYANWKWDFELYKDILEFIKQEKIRLVGLNVPFHIPSKIALGGIENLLDDDRKHIPPNIDTSIDAHRAYVEKIYNHHRATKMDSFDFFYEAQCAWEDTMAASVALNMKDDRMIVIAGNGHIIRKFGIPDRTFRQTGADFRTVYPATAGNEVESDYADYIWVTSREKPHAKK